MTKNKSIQSFPSNNQHMRVIHGNNKVKSSHVVNKPIKLFKHIWRKVDQGTYTWREFTEKQNINKTCIDLSRIDTLDLVGNQDRSSRWKGTFLSHTSSNKRILASIMGCHSSIKCITRPSARSSLRRFNGAVFVTRLINLSSMSENTVDKIWLLGATCRPGTTPAGSDARVALFFYPHPSEPL